MGAQSDFIGAIFVPDDRYKAQQLAMIQKLKAAGVSADQLETMFLVPFDLISSEGSKDE